MSAVCGMVLMGMALSAPVHAQAPRFNSFHTWTDLTTIVAFNDRFRYDGSYGLRGLISDDDWSQVFIGPSVRYRPTRVVSFHGGLSLFYNILPGDDLPELRPWIGVRLSGPGLKGFSLRNTVRLELRALYRSTTQSWETGLRGRWQLALSSPFFRLWSEDEFYALASVEPFFDLEGSVAGFGDRIRVTAGLGKVFSDAWRAELNYMFHKVRVPDQGGALELDDHVLRLRFFYTVR